METLTDEQRADRIGALTRELRGYEIHGDKERAGEVKAELNRLGTEAATPAKRSTKAKPKKGTAL
jgi:hypothetical protein